MDTRIQKAIDRFDLQAYVEEQFEDIMYAANGEELRINCFAPNGCAQADNDHKLYVNPSKKRWICFRCGYGTQQQIGTSSIIRFIADAEGIPPILVRHRLSKVVQPSPQEELEDLLQNLFTPAVAAKAAVSIPISMPTNIFYVLRENTQRIPSAQRAYTYARSRGLSDNDLAGFDVRFRPAIQSVKIDRQWSERIIFPIYDMDGNLCSASGRLVNNTKKRPKWWHWPETHIDQLLWPLTQMRATSNTHVVLVEGIFDAYAVLKLTGWEVFCTFGHKLSSGQINLLRKRGVKKVTLAWDRDSKQAMITAAKNLEVASIEAGVIPFINESYWQKWDLGAMISVGDDAPCFTTKELQRIATQELGNPISIGDPETVRWVIK